MDAAVTQAEPSSPQARTERFAWGPVLCLWVLLTGWSLLRVPIPGVNEPHYLGKARHWWNPDWCPGDFFLDSSNPHLVYYATFGSLTQWLAFDQAAFAGRAIGLLIVALGWQRLSQSLTGRRWDGVLALPVFLTLHATGNFSGEWLVGGTESKVPAYGFLFWAIGNLLIGRLLPAGALAGLAVSFHPLVGLWGVIAGAIATAGVLLQRRRRHDLQPTETTYSLVNIAAAVGLGVLLALPGLIPALQTLEGGDPQLEHAATQLQVAERLSHHLDPMRFPKTAYWFAGSLLAIWLLLLRDFPNDSRQRWWRWFVLSAVFIAVVGIAIGFGPRPMAQMPGFGWRSSLLKFYPFRLGDLILPVAVSLAAVQAVMSWTQQPSASVSKKSLLTAGLVACVIGAISIPFPDQNPSRLSPREQEDWIAACHWLRDHTERTAQVYATDVGWAIKWFAERPEYVNYKDVPQDAKSLVEWNQRLWKIARWRIAVMADGQVTPEELADLKQQTGLYALLVGRFGPVKAKPAYANENYRVYVLP
ncbi:DUF6798 domain-containing protein [Planctomicrobium piriforme]|uniref:DUF6798 domain-containing protein n=1 Tax=Planctomicrobium piriforme TaxID=1576369 RepID=UPI000B824FA4|nr:DUF6798 domain-containing protein [Planctomicrobium piriforme]